MTEFSVHGFRTIWQQQKPTTKQNRIKEKRENNNKFRDPGRKNLRNSASIVP